MSLVIIVYTLSHKYNVIIVLSNAKIQRGKRETAAQTHTLPERCPSDACLSVCLQLMCRFRPPPLPRPCPRLLPVPAPLNTYQDQVQEFSESHVKTQPFQHFCKHDRLDIYVTETVHVLLSAERSREIPTRLHSLSPQQELSERALSFKR